MGKKLGSYTQIGLNSDPKVLLSSGILDTILASLSTSFHVWEKEQ